MYSFDRYNARPVYRTLNPYDFIAVYDTRHCFVCPYGIYTLYALTCDFETQPTRYYADYNVTVGSVTPLGQFSHFRDAHDAFLHYCFELCEWKENELKGDQKQ